MSRQHKRIRSAATFVTAVLMVLGAGCSASEPNAGGATTTVASNTVSSNSSATTGAASDTSASTTGRPESPSGDESRRSTRSDSTSAEAARSSNASAAAAAPPSPPASVIAQQSAAQASADAAQASVMASKSAAENVPAPPTRDLFGAPDLSLTLNEIRDDVGTDLQFFTIGISTKSVTVQAIDPAAPDKLLSRQWFDGGMGRADPLPNDWDPAFLRSVVFTTADFDVTTVAAAATAAPVDSGLDGVTVDTVDIGRSGNIFVGQGADIGCDICIVVRLRGPGVSPTLYYDTNGTLVKTS